MLKLFHILLAVLALAVAPSPAGAGAPIILMGRGAGSPPPPPTYSLGVVAAGAQAVDDLQRGIGTTISLDGAALTPAASYTFTGCTPAIGTNSGEAYVWFTGSADCSGDHIDFTGRTVYVSMTGGAHLTLSYSKFKYVSAQPDPNQVAVDGIRLLKVGFKPNNVEQASTAVTVTITRSEFDGTGSTASPEALTNCVDGSSVTIQTSYIHDTPRDFMTWDCTGTLQLDHNYFSRIAMGPLKLNGTSHMEIGHGFQGTQNVLYNLIDMTATASIPYVTLYGAGTNWTALWYASPGSSASAVNSVVNWSYNVVHGVKQHVDLNLAPISYTWQWGHCTGTPCVPNGFNNNMTITLKGNVFDRGSSGSYTDNSTGGLVDGTGNYSDVTGAPL